MAKEMRTELSCAAEFSFVENDNKNGYLFGATPRTCLDPSKSTLDSWELDSDGMRELATWLNSCADRIDSEPKEK